MEAEGRRRCGRELRRASGGVRGVGVLEGGRGEGVEVGVGSGGLEGAKGELLRLLGLLVLLLALLVAVLKRLLLLLLRCLLS